MALLDGRVASLHQNWLMVWDPADTDVEAIALGHYNMVKSMVAVADGRILLAELNGMFGDRGSRLLLRDTKMDGELSLLGEHDAVIRDLAVLPDGRVASLDGGHVRLWDPARPQWRSKSVGDNNSGAWSMIALPDGRLASLTSGRLLLWDPSSREREPITLGQHEHVVKARLRSDGRIVLPDGRAITNGSNRYGGVWGPPLPVILWREDVSDDEPIVLEYDEAGIEALVATSDGLLVTGGYDRRLLVWDPASDRGPALLGHHDGLRALAALPDGRIVVSSGPEGREEVVIWDVAGRVPTSRVAIPAKSITVLRRQRLRGPNVVAAHRGGGLSAWAIRYAR